MGTEIVPAVSELTAIQEFGREPAKAVIQRATERAQAVADVIKKRKLYSSISGRDYVQIEGWTTMGAMYGLTAHVTRTEPIEGGGWFAHAELLNVGTGEAVAAADAECGTIGDVKWIGRPSFQQRSMAQTRACSKAFRLEQARDGAGGLRGDTGRGN